MDNNNLITEKLSRSGWLVTSQRDERGSIICKAVEETAEPETQDILSISEDLYGNEGKKIKVRLNDKEMTRRVYYSSKIGLYIVVRGKAYFEYDFRDSLTIKLDSRGLPITY